MDASTLNPAANAELDSKTVLLAAPRGFCAGVDRAILIVEESLKKFGAPVYVRHEIVHNRHVVNRLKGLGAIFVEELDDCPDDRPVVFSAHGVPKSVPAAAQARDMTVLDATCPLVSKVHIEAERHHANGHHILMIGHAGHPEVIGTMGQLPDICYATTNRQMAVKAIAEKCDLLLVIGSVTSSNSKRLVEVGAKAGADEAMLISSADSIDWNRIAGAKTIGLSAGASAPEYLTDGVIAALKSKYNITMEEVVVTEEKVIFRLPKMLRE